MYVQSANRNFLLQIWKRRLRLGAFLWGMHLCSHQGQSQVGVSWFLLEVLLMFECVCVLLVFETSLLVCFFKLFVLLRMEQYLGSGGPPCLWKWICLMALAALCLRVSVPVHRCWHKLSESGCCAEKSGAGLDRVSWLALGHFLWGYLLNYIRGKFLEIISH